MGFSALLARDVGQADETGRNGIILELSRQSLGPRHCRALEKDDNHKLVLSLNKIWILTRVWKCLPCVTGIRISKNHSHWPVRQVTMTHFGSSTAAQLMSPTLSLERSHHSAISRILQELYSFLK